MAKCKYCILHIPSGTLFSNLIFLKKSQGVAFLNSLPVRNGFFNPPENLPYDYEALSFDAQTSLRNHINQTIWAFRELDRGLHPQKGEALFNMLTRTFSYKEMIKYSPTEFDVVPIKQSALTVLLAAPFLGVSLD